MAKIFKKRKKKPGKDKAPGRPRFKKEEKFDLMDPVLYNGGLDKEKYPQLPLENEAKQEEEIENPLNKR